MVMGIPTFKLGPTIASQYNNISLLLLKWQHKNGAEEIILMLLVINENETWYKNI